LVAKKLYRSSGNRILGGVAGGIAEYFSLNASILRLFIAIFIFTGIGMILYILAWIIIPLNPASKSKKSAVQEIREQAETLVSEIKKTIDDTENEE